MAAGKFGTLIFKVREYCPATGGLWTKDSSMQLVIIARLFRGRKVFCHVDQPGRHDAGGQGSYSHCHCRNEEKAFVMSPVATRALLEDTPFKRTEKRLSYFMPLNTTSYTSSNSLSVPIKYYEKKVGVLNLTDTKNNKRLTAKQVREAVRITDYLAVYLYASQANDLLEKNIKKYEDALAQVIKPTR